MTQSEIILDIINQTTCDLIDYFTTNEFIEKCGDKIFEQTGESLSDEEVKKIISDKISPLFDHLSKWVMENK